MMKGKYEWWKRKVTYDEGQWSDDKLMASQQQGDSITRIRIHTVKWRGDDGEAGCTGWEYDSGDRKEVQCWRSPENSPVHTFLGLFLHSLSTFQSARFLFLGVFPQPYFFGLQKTTCPENTVTTPNAQVSCLDAFYGVSMLIWVSWNFAAFIL